MSGFGADEDEMRLFAKLSERELDGVLAGHASRDELEEVATFFRELRIDLEETLPAGVESRHLAAIFQEARHVQPAVSELQTTPALHRRPTLRNPFRRLAARATIAAVGLAALAAFGGAAYAGALPKPVQAKVADIVRHVGISLPTSHHHSKPRGGGVQSGVQSTSTLDQPTGADMNDGSSSGNRSNGTQGNEQRDQKQDTSRSNDRGAQQTDTSGQGEGRQGNDPSSGNRSNDRGAQQTDTGGQGEGRQGNDGASQNGTSHDGAVQGGATQSGTTQSDGGAEKTRTNGDQSLQTTTVQAVPSQPEAQDTTTGGSTPSSDPGRGGDQQGTDGGNGK